MGVNMSTKTDKILKQALTFDDVLLSPDYSEIKPESILSKIFSTKKI